ncbi:hypothetical protein THAOC_14754, partial [Thalassiosira oceanica]
NEVNSIDGLTWEFTELDESVDFMDITVSIAGDRLRTTLYEKPMALYLYIPPHSAHARNHFLRMNLKANLKAFQDTRTHPAKTRANDHEASDHGRGVALDQLTKVRCVGEDALSPTDEVALAAAVILQVEAQDNRDSGEDRQPMTTDTYNFDDTDSENGTVPMIVTPPTPRRRQKRPKARSRPAENKMKASQESFQRHEDAKGIHLHRRKEDGPNPRFPEIGADVFGSPVHHHIGSSGSRKSLDIKMIDVLEYGDVDMRKTAPHSYSPLALTMVFGFPVHPCIMEKSIGKSYPKSCLAEATFDLVGDDNGPRSGPPPNDRVRYDKMFLERHANNRGFAPLPREYVGTYTTKAFPLASFWDWGARPYSQRGSPAETSRRLSPDPKTMRYFAEELRRISSSVANAWARANFLGNDPLLWPRLTEGFEGLPNLSPAPPNNRAPPPPARQAMVDRRLRRRLSWQSARVHGLYPQLVRSDEVPGQGTRNHSFQESFRQHGLDESTALRGDYFSGLLDLGANQCRGDEGCECMQRQAV